MPFQIYTAQVPDHLTSAMIKGACRDPGQSRMLIEAEGLQSLGFSLGTDESTSALRNGVPLLLGSNMLKTPHQKLEFPLVHYEKHTAIRGSVWTIKPDYVFSRTKPVSFKYQILWTSGVNYTSPEYYETLFKAQFARCGVQETQATNINPTNDTMVTFDTFEGKLKEAKDSGVKLVMLIISQFNRDDYRQFKLTADRKVGIQGPGRMPLPCNAETEQMLFVANSGCMRHTRPG